MRNINLFNDRGFRFVIKALLSVVFISSLSFTALAAGWEQDSRGWKYGCSCSDSPELYYPSNETFTIDDAKYGFDKDGYMVTGWWHDDVYYYDYHQNSALYYWYYFNEDGKMRYEPLNEDGKTYYFDEDGECLNPDGQAISQYPLAVKKLVIDNSDLVDSIEIGDNADLVMLKSHISAVEKLRADVNNLPNDIPNNYKIFHAHLLAYTQRLESKVELLRQIVANIESQNTDYQKLITQIEEYNGKKLGTD